MQSVVRSSAWLAKSKVQPKGILDDIRRKSHFVYVIDQGPLMRLGSLNEITCIDVKPARRPSP